MKLYPYQTLGVKHLTTKSPDPKSATHKLLGDACGLGKTVQACQSLVKVGAKSALIITPAPELIKHSWRKTLIDTGVAQPDEIQILTSGKDTISNRPFKIVSYELLLNKDIYRGLFWDGWKDATIIDEAHRLKSLDSKRSLNIIGGGSNALVSRGYWKWLLSGTFVPNRPIELYPILSSLFPSALVGYESYAAFGKHFCNGYETERGWDFNGASNLEDLAERIAPFYLRREIEDVYAHMPEVVERVCYIDLGDMDYDETNTPQATLRKEIGLAKVPYVLEYVKDRLTQNVDKLLVFVYHREVAEQLHNGIKESVLLYGGLSGAQKSDVVNAFLQDSNCRVMVAQLNVAGEGIDGLQHVCSNIIDAEPDWVAGGYEQRVGRLRRIGQTKPVDYVALIAENTLDDAIVGSRIRKQKNIDKLFRSIAEIQNKPLLQTKEINMATELENACVELIKAVTALVNAKASEAPKESNAKPANGNGKPATAAGGAASKETASTTKTDATVAKEAEVGVTADDVRSAAGDAIARLGESEETRQAIIAIVKKNGGKNGKADGVPVKNMAACIAAINELAPAEAEESGEDNPTSFL